MDKKMKLFKSVDEKIAEIGFMKNKLGKRASILAYYIRVGFTDSTEVFFTYSRKDGRILIDCISIVNNVEQWHGHFCDDIPDTLWLTKLETTLFRDKLEEIKRGVL